MSKVEKLLDLEASAQADIDDLHEKKADEIEARISELLNYPGERDPGTFELFGSNTEEAFLDFFSIPVFDRDPMWSLAASAMMVAARMQAWVELLGVDAIAMMEANGEAIDAQRKGMTTAEIKEAAFKGIGKARINGEKERRKASG